MAQFELTRICHSCFRLVYGGLTVYMDPFRLQRGDRADVIFISHSHYDHCSAQDLDAIITPKTVIVASVNCKEALAPFQEKVAAIHYVSPGETLTVKTVPVRTIPAYNLNKFRSPGKPFHSKADNGVGVVIQLGPKTLLHAGDTDATPELLAEKVDIALLPVSGTYVMTPEEAAGAANKMKPALAVPMHYGAIVGTREDAEKFRKLAKVPVQVLD